jgi:uncharacterized membrane protein YjjB (DUF3815 family)
MMPYLIPGLIQLACAALYVLGNKAKKKKWICSVAALALNVFAVIYLLLSELGMDIALVFLLASFAVAISLGPRR